MMKRVKLRYFNDSFPCKKGHFYDAVFVKVLVVDAYQDCPKIRIAYICIRWAAGYFIFLKHNLFHLCSMAHYLTRIWFAGSV